MSKKKENEQKEWSQRTREIWLAGLGALSAVEKEGSKLFHNLVDLGSEFEKKRKDQVNELWKDVSGELKELESRVGKSVDKAEETVERNISSIVSGVGIPTQKELKKLSDKVDELTKKLEKLTDEKAATAIDEKKGKRKSKSTRSGK